MPKDSDPKNADYIQEKLDSIVDICANIDKEVALQKQAFDDHLAQDERMYQEFKRMNDILQQNTNSLQEHMHRSDLLENIVTKMEQRFSPVAIEFDRKKAVREWVTEKLKFLGKIGAALTALGTLWVLLEPLLKHLL